jgi:hypothetical protein
MAVTRKQIMDAVAAYQTAATKVGIIPAGTALKVIPGDRLTQWDVYYTEPNSTFRMKVDGIDLSGAYTKPDAYLRITSATRALQAVDRARKALMSLQNT